MARLWNQFESGSPPKKTRNLNKQVMEGLIKNDVFLNQNNDFVGGKVNQSQAKDFLEREAEDTPLIIDYLFPEENTQSYLGCVCCDSCHSQSQQFMYKTSQMLDQFRRQMFELKDSVRKEMSDINTQLNQMRLMFAKLLLDVQIKLNKKNYQLDKVLDISQVLQHTNDFLLIDNKHLKQKMENVIKENIKYRNKLGYDLKIVVNRKECDKYIKQMARKKRSNLSKAKIIDEQTKKDNETSTKIGSERVEDKNIVQPSVGTNASLHQTISTVTSNTINNKQRSPDKTLTINKVQIQNSNISRSINITPKPLILHYDAIRKTPQTAKTLKKLTHLETNSNGLKSTKTYSKTNLINSNPNLSDEVRKEQLGTEINGFFSKYQSNHFINNLNHSYNKNNSKKRKIDYSVNDSSQTNGILPINGIVKSEPQPFANLNRNQSLSSKDFSKYKDRNK